MFQLYSINVYRNFFRVKIPKLNVEIDVSLKKKKLKNIKATSENVKCDIIFTSNK